jgi:hypothetical protein
MSTATTDDLLLSIATIHQETTTMLRTLAAIDVHREEDRKEARRRTVEIRAKLDEFFQWLIVAPLEKPTM